MRALIRHLKSGLFYAGDWRWTAKQEKACDFGSTFQALRFAGDNHLRGVEVVLAFDGPRSDLTMGLEVWRRPPKYHRDGRDSGGFSSLGF
jgi:hypothetical protein